MKIIPFVLGALATNAYLVFDEETNRAMIIDPAAEADVLIKALDKYGLSLQKIVLTHGHADHIGALNGLREKFPEVPVYMHEEDAEYLTNPALNLSAYQAEKIVCEPADFYLKPGEKVSLDDITLEVLHTPGHTPGSISLYAKDYDIVFSGDALFNGSVGRTDFPGGSMEVLLQGIREELLPLPEETIVLSGHGPSTTIGEEKQWNPFLGGTIW